MGAFRREKPAAMLLPPAALTSVPPTKGEIRGLAAVARLTDPFPLFAAPSRADVPLPVRSPPPLSTSTRSLLTSPTELLLRSRFAGSNAVAGTASVDLLHSRYAAANGFAADSSGWPCTAALPAGAAAAADGLISGPGCLLLLLFFAEPISAPDSDNIDDTGRRNLLRSSADVAGSADASCRSAVIPPPAAAAAADGLNWGGCSLLLFFFTNPMSALESHGVDDAGRSKPVCSLAGCAAAVSSASSTSAALPAAAVAAARLI